MIKSKGFTLIEMVVVIALMGIISVILGRALFAGYQQFRTAQAIADVDWQGFISLERMANDLHSIRPSGISTAGSTQLTFTNVNGETIQYQLSGANLLRNSQILANGLQAFNLSYLDKNGATTATVSNIRYINISLSATKNNISSSYSTTVGMRGMQ